MKKEEKVKHPNRNFISKKLTFCSHVNNSVTIQELGFNTTKRECKFSQTDLPKVTDFSINDIKTKLESNKNRENKND